jgi:hypothetical protein
MKILNYKYLNEAILPSLGKAGAVTNIPQKNVDALVGLNLKNSTTMGDAAVVSSYRLIGLEFYEKQSYNNFLTGAILQNGVRVENKMSYNFFTYYENDDCYLYPFTGVDVPRFGSSTIKTYIKLNLFKKANPNQPEDIKIYFDDFKESRTINNEYNTKNYSLEILSNFDEINRENKITDEGVLNLRNYAATDPSQTNYYLSFIMVSEPVSVINNRDITNNVFYNIDFYPPRTVPQNQPTNANTIINNFNIAFSGRQLRLLQETNTSSSPLGTNAPQGFAQSYPYVTIFTKPTGNIPYNIYTIRKLLTYKGQARTDCYIGTNNNEFIQCELEFN